MSLLGTIGRASLVVVGALAVADPAIAGLPVPVPGPMLGAGVPALAVFAAGYLLIRRVRKG